VAKCPNQCGKPLPCSHPEQREELCETGEINRIVAELHIANQIDDIDGESS